MVGRTISHYRIHSRLGAGGMGVVYKAEDTRLERMVALKFLAPQLVSDHDSRKRFEREAKAVAALDHPNICTVFEIDEAEGTVFLAMAFVEGDTVKARMAQRLLPLEEAIGIAGQTAEGLRAAHEKGIIHRDIKPANVMVNPRGQVKIMDFGLARLTDATVTQTSSVLGTPAYMSPEQTRGQLTDQRTDIWSFGVMLYEMITGRLPFRGDRAETVFHAIRNDDPEPIPAQREGVPAPLEQIVARCLAKDPAERYQHTDELVADLSALRRTVESGVLTAGFPTRTAALPPAAKPSRSWMRVAAIAAIAVVSTVLLFVGIRALHRSPGPETLRTVKFTITPAQLVRGGANEIDAEVSISADGEHIAYVDSQAGQLYIRDIDQEQARPVPGAVGVYQAFWSPDNQFIAYAAGRMCGGQPCDLVKIPVQGGSPTVITRPAGAFRRASWSSDGETIVYCDTTGLYTIPSRGGPATRFIEHPHVEHPSFLDLPGGRKAFLFQSSERGQPGHGIYVQLMNENQRRLIIMTSSSNPYPTYSSTGHIVYSDGSGDSVAIWALPFSLDTLQATGKPFPIAQRGSSPQVSRTGTLVYSDVPSRLLQLGWYDRSGKLLSTIGEPAAQTGPVLSPDGRRLLVEDLTKDPDLWVYDVPRGMKTRLTVDKAREVFPVWTPSGDEITYSSVRNGGIEIFSRASNGTTDERLLAGPPLDQLAPDWSSDGRFLIYMAQSSGTKSYLLYRERRPDGSLAGAAVFLKSGFNETQPRFSPDGHFVAYVSDQSGTNEVYVRQFPSGAGQWQISSKGGALPHWRRDGRELFYLERNRLMSVSVVTRPAFMPAAPVLLFEKRSFETGYDVSADGQRFVMLERPAGDPPLAIHVVHNWFEEFRGRQR